MRNDIYFVEVGNKEFQERDNKEGNLSISSDYGLKIWDKDGIDCIIKSSLHEHLDKVEERELKLLSEL